MRFDLLMIAIGLLLLVAMTITLLFGREYSRHGYGVILYRTYNPNNGCKYLTQRREGVEKARKEKHFKSQDSHPLRLS